MNSGNKKAPARSLSARRAWIEIYYHSRGLNKAEVALRKESVDRNIVKYISYLGCFRSLSARRAWIEIRKELFLVAFKGVALRKESVDRNIARLSCADTVSRRSPQGERG